MRGVGERDRAAALPWWAAAAALAAVVAVLSSRPADDLGPDALWKVDKLVHGATWCALAALIAIGGVARGWRGVAAAAVAIALAAAYGVVDELHQAHTPGRDASVGDAVADAVGAVVGAVAGVSFARWRSSGPTRAAGP